MIKNKDVFYGILDGKIQLLNEGYKVSGDAIWLAASVDGSRAKTILDVGVGSGGVILPILYREPHLIATGIDVNQAELERCKQNVFINDRKIELLNQDILTWKSDRQFDIVVSNPPFFDGTPSPFEHKIITHYNQDIREWVAACAKRLKPQGKIYIITTPTKAIDVIRGFPDAVGAIEMQPILTKPEAAEVERVIISGKLGSRSGSIFKKSLKVRNPDGTHTQTAIDVLKNGKTLF
jgi:tRNA1(Val) A37 N6-methylase TrmN6